MHLRTIALAALLLFLAACGDVSQTTPTAVSTTPPPGSAGTETPRDDGIQLPDNSRDPTFESGNGGIKGVLQNMQGQPVAGMAVYLAHVLPGEAGTAIQFDPTNSPMCITDVMGRFYFDNVEPSTKIAPTGYSLMTWTPVQTKIVPPPGGQEEEAVLVEVRADQITDLGTLRMIPPE